MIKTVILAVVAVLAALATMYQVLRRAWHRESTRSNPRPRTVADSIAEASRDNVLELRPGPNRKKAKPASTSAAGGGGDAA